MKYYPSYVDYTWGLQFFPRTGNPVRNQPGLNGKWSHSMHSWNTRVTLWLRLVAQWVIVFSPNDFRDIQPLKLPNKMDIVYICDTMYIWIRQFLCSFFAAYHTRESVQEGALRLMDAWQLKWPFGDAVFLRGRILRDTKGILGGSSHLVILVIVSLQP